MCNKTAMVGKGWLAVLLAILLNLPMAAETEVRTNMEFYNTVYRSRNSSWYYFGSGLADIRLDAISNTNMKAQVALEFSPVDLSGATSVSSIPVVVLKRFWIKSSFPSWRLTLGKTKLAWGNGYVFNSGDIIFGSQGPHVDFTRSNIRDNTAWLTAINIPTGRFSYLEAVLLPPNFKVEKSDKSSVNVQIANHTSGGFRYFGRVNGWRLEGGYLYKGDSKLSGDVLGHRPYFSFHGHAGVDLYGSLSLAAGWDGEAGQGGIYRDSWDELSKTISLSVGAYHQIQMGYENTLTMRFEGLILPWQHWNPQNYNTLAKQTGERYGLFLYPELTLVFRSLWFVGIQSLISPVDASAQITTSLGWDVFQGFTLVGYGVLNAGDNRSMFAWDRSGNWPDRSESSDSELFPQLNGISIAIGARYRY